METPHKTRAKGFILAHAASEGWPVEWTCPEEFSLHMANQVEGVIDVRWIAILRILIRIMVQEHWVCHVTRNKCWPESAKEGPHHLMFHFLEGVTIHLSRVRWRVILVLWRVLALRWRWEAVILVIVLSEVHQVLEFVS